MTDVTDAEAAAFMEAEVQQEQQQTQEETVAMLQAQNEALARLIAKNKQALSDLGIVPVNTETTQHAAIVPPQ